MANPGEHADGDRTFKDALSDNHVTLRACVRGLFAKLVLVGVLKAPPEALYAAVPPEVMRRAHEMALKGWDGWEGMILTALADEASDILEFWLTGLNLLPPGLEEAQT